MSRFSSLSVSTGVLIVAGLLALSGCSSDAAAGGSAAAPAANGGDASELSLADTKSPVQFIRNEAAARLPLPTLEEIAELTDTAESCSADDPNMLSWQSSVYMTIASKSASRTGNIFGNLIMTFTNDGWEASEWDDEDVSLSSVLTSTESVATVEVSAEKDADDDGKDASITIAVNGPCVATDGPDSDEVTTLEAHD